ncbi:MAG: SPFH domain-containing protein [Chitinophagales bacterium]|nr:SPFH domain-containing protein [Chitinophagales bacterium]
MGLFDFVSNEFIEVIDWVETDQDTIIQKFPDKGNNIKMGAQLTVRESQIAIFVNEGKIADIYQPGRYELTTENMPVLTTLKGWKYGFKSPFKVDIYFVSTKQFTNLKWGTPNPVMVRDPEFKQVRIKAFGTYFIRVNDAALFFKEFAGTAPVLRIAAVEDRLRDIVSPKFAESLAEANVAVLDLVSRYSEMGEVIKPFLQQDFTPFGIELTKFQITSTTLPPEVEAFYDKMTTMNMVGDMSKFTQFQTATSIEKAAENEGGGAGAGVGIGAGFAMGNLMSQNMNQQNQVNQNQVVQSKDDIMKMLKDLGELKNAGILTEEEFDTKKKELLAKL